jgi:uncharacterized protein YecE (DUF72 family)
MDTTLSEVPAHFRFTVKLCRTWKIAVEFRNSSWYIPEVNELLHRYQAARVLHDMPASAIAELPAHRPVLPFIYLRFHGPKGDYTGGYANSTLKFWAEKVKEWLTMGNEVYVYFNNTIGDALTDLTRLKAFINPASNPSAAGAAQ